VLLVAEPRGSRVGMYPCLAEGAKRVTISRFSHDHDPDRLRDDDLYFEGAFSARENFLESGST
jgi:hypothetical protein